MEPLLKQIYMCATFEKFPKFKPKTMRDIDNIIPLIHI